MSATRSRPEPVPQSAIAASPFPPIADYAFLSNCHTGAPGPSENEDTILPRTRPHVDDDADDMLVRTVEWLEGRVEIDFVCEPVFDYGRTAAGWVLVEGDRAADASGAGQTIRLRSDLALGIEGGRVRGRHVLGAGDRADCVLSWAEGLAAPSEPNAFRARQSLIALEPGALCLSEWDITPKPRLRGTS